MNMKTASIQISKDEYKERSDKLLVTINAEGLSGVILFDSTYILYYTGFAFIPTERPIAFLLNNEGEKILFVPRLEVEHAQANTFINIVEYYLEYPAVPHPMEKLKQTLDSFGFGSAYAADTDGYPWILGYQGPTLSELIGFRPKKIAAIIEEQMMIKSPAEISLICESIKWGHLAHQLLQRYTRVGATETDASLRASMEATLAMLDTIGPIYKAQSPFSRGATAGYRGQIGRYAAIPHALANNIIFQLGDNLVTGAGAPVWGYHSELERTMVVGPASDEQEVFFAHMLALQDTAFSAMVPGASCADVDNAVKRYYVDNDLMPYWKHHVGHAIGLRYHEGPFLDYGDLTVLQAGMVFTVEPGLYIPDLGGFRHSDTVLITEEGLEILTYYPRELGNLTIPL
jgi:Xaa-Pro aminopeptidase